MAFRLPSDSRSHLTFAMTPILPIRINMSPGTAQAVILQLSRTSPFKIDAFHFVPFRIMAHAMTSICRATATIATFLRVLLPAEMRL